MCGLYGAFRTQKAPWQDLAKIKRFVKEAAFLSVMRGHHGSGIGLVFDDFATEVTKTHLDSPSWLQTQQYEDQVDNQLYKATAVIGHTRFTTSGGGGAKNAHPFEFTNTDKSNLVMMTHNGHIQNYTQLTSKIPGFTHGVDSAHIARALAEAKDPNEEVLSKLKGAYALMWYDYESKTINTARGSQRPLALAYSKCGRYAYYMSEDMMLKFVLEHAGIEFDKVVTLKEHELKQWSLEGSDLRDTADETYTPYVEPAYQNNWMSNHNSPGYNAGICNNTEHTVVRGGQTSLGEGKARVEWVRATRVQDFSPYRGGGSANESMFGYGWAKHPRDVSSVVRIDGVSRHDWNTKYKFSIEHQSGHVKGFAIPVIITATKRDIDEDMGAYTVHHATIHKELFDAELLRQGYVPPALQLLTGPSSPKVEMTRTVRGPNGTEIPYSEWRLIANQGCKKCPGRILDIDENACIWDLHEIKGDGGQVFRLICPDCARKDGRRAMN